MKIGIFGVLGLVILLSCAQKDQPSPSPKEKAMKTAGSAEILQKFGPQLRQRLRTQPDSAEVNLFIRCSRDVDEQLRGKLAAAGIRVGSVTGKMCTAAGTLAALKKLAQLAEIEYVELSGTAGKARD